MKKLKVRNERKLIYLFLQHWKPEKYNKYVTERSLEFQQRHQDVPIKGQLNLE